MTHLQPHGPAWLLHVRRDALAWCQGKLWWPRAGLLSYLFYAGVNHLRDPLYRSWFAGLTLALHELGHLVLFAPPLLSVAGGSLFQVAAPAATAVYLWRRQHDFFGFAVGTAWLSFSLWELATYVDDANKERLPLVGFSDHPVHDWAYLLTAWHLLNECEVLATLTRLVACGVWAMAMMLGGWICWKIRKSASSQERLW